MQKDKQETENVFSLEYIYQGMLYWYKQQYSSSGLWQKYYDGGKQCIPFFPVMLKDGTATTDTANKLPIFELGLNVIIPLTRK